MSATQHTPGPWKKAVTGNVLDGRGCKVCTVDPLPGMNNREKESNARLIASAPDLLADLEGLVESVSHLLPHNHPALVNARASIARATGSEAEGAK